VVTYRLTNWFKLFCLDITTLTMPNLIVNDLFLVQPMSSFSGYLTYMEYALGEAKGGVGGRTGDEFNTIIQNPFVWGEMTPERAAYTGEAVVEAATATSIVLAWTPVVKKAFKDATGAEFDVKVVKADGTEVFKNVEADGKTVTGLTVGDKVAYKYDNVTIPQEKLPTLVGHMKGITLQARARRIAVYYSQIAAYQA